MDKPLSTLWRNHISSEKADILMKVRKPNFFFFSLSKTIIYKESQFSKTLPPQVTVVGSGLRAGTKEHGLTEYWANRYFN